MMIARTRLLQSAAALAALFATACGDAVTGPSSRSFAQTASRSGGSGSGGGTSSGGTSGGGSTGGGSTQSIPQVAGTWNGQEHYDPSLSAFFFPGTMDPAASFTLTEDASGNITGIDNIMHVSMSGKASSNGSIVLQDGTYYGQKLTVDITGSVVCSDGSTGQVMSGKFQRKEGFGTISVDNCPVI